MKLLAHERTHSLQQKDSEKVDLVVLLQTERIAHRSSLIMVQGKTAFQKKTAVASLARQLGKHLLRVDLSEVISKYIDETEKNLDIIFRRAASSGWILFFDEADALFGKRTSVRDAHDKYANHEVNYLLNKIEKHRGIVILATNHQQARGLTKASRLNKYMLKFPPFV